MFNHKFVRLGLLLAAFSIAQPFQGASAREDNVVSLTVSGLEPGSNAPSPENALRHRVAVAAAKVCDLAVGAANRGHDAHIDCVRQARRDAEPQVKAILAARASAGAVVASAAARTR